MPGRLAGAVVAAAANYFPFHDLADMFSSALLPCINISRHNSFALLDYRNTVHEAILPRTTRAERRALLQGVMPFGVGIAEYTTLPVSLGYKLTAQIPRGAAAHRPAARQARQFRLSGLRNTKG